jgi:hypothetical protein
MDDTAPPKTGFRREHPAFFWGAVALIALLLGATAAVGMRIPRYHREAAEITARMSQAEKQTQAEILNHRQKRTQLAVSLLQRDIRIRALETKGIHLAVVLKDSVLELRQGRAVLRRVKLSIGADSIVKAPDGRTWRFVRGVGERHVAKLEQGATVLIPDWVYASRGQPVPPESERRVAGGMGSYTITLDDGSVIYSHPQAGPLKDAVIPGSFMTSAHDLDAIFAVVKEDTPVYIY